MNNTRSTEKKSLTYFILLLISPITSVLISAIDAIKNNKYHSLLIFAVIFALYASGINITKIPIHDQVNYLEQFNNVGTKGFINTLIYGGNDSIREPIYGIYVYVSYYLFMGNAKLFFLLTSFLILFFHYMALINIAKKNKFPNYIVITGIIILTCFAPFYSLTLHLVRQLLATGIALYAISLRAIDDRMYKKYILFMILAVFTHSTSILLLLLSFIPGINKELTLKKLPYFIILVTIITFAFPKISQNVLGDGDSSFMTYALERATTAEGLSDKADGANMSKTLLYIVAAPLIILSLRSYFQKSANVSPLITNICLMMCIFVCLVSYSPLIQYRYFFMLYSFIMFIPIYVFKMSSTKSKLFCLTISALMIIYFMTSHDKNYDYAELAEIICYPYPSYFFINPY